MHGCLRAVLNQRKVWELVGTNPAQGVRLPPKKARKPPVVLANRDIRRVIEALPEPTKSMVVDSPRIGEVTALRWGRIHSDRIEIVERFYEGEFDDTKTDAGRGASRLIPPGILRGAPDAAWQRSKYRNPGELVFTSHVVPPHLGPDAYTAWGDAQVNNARLFLEGTPRPESFYDFGGAIKSITCLSFRR